jgi:hypothetical protein
LDRKEIIELIRAHAAKHGVVWLTERGAIVLAPNGEAACIKGVGRDYFTRDCPLGFITGTAGLSGIRPDDIGDAKLDELSHERMWEEFDTKPHNPIPAAQTVPSDEEISRAVAKHTCEVLSSIPEEDTQAIRNADKTQRTKIVNEFMDEAVRRAVKEIRERKASESVQ